MDAKQIAQKISSEIEFEFKPDEEHLLAEAIKNYFENDETVDKAPRLGKLIKEIEKLKNVSQSLSDQISSLHSNTKSIIKSFSSKENDRDVKLVLETLSDNASWLSSKTQRVLRKLEERKTPDKGGPKKRYAQRVFVLHLIGIYERANNKPAGSGTYLSYSKGDERKIGPFGRFVQVCLNNLGTDLGVSAIDTIISEAIKLSNSLEKTPPTPAS